MGLRPRSGFGAGRYYKSAAHHQAAMRSRGDFMASRVAVHIDMREIRKLQLALRDAGAGYKRSQAIIAQSMNRGARRLKTKLKRSLKRWTGINRIGKIADRMTVIHATPGKMIAGVTVQGRHFRITSADFNARWRRSWAGGRHKAWNRSQTAKGSFMAFSGRGKRYGGGLLFTRTTSKRLPIVPLWGPNPVREIERRERLVRIMVKVEARWIVGECRRRASIELMKAKTKYGL